MPLDIYAPCSILITTLIARALRHFIGGECYLRHLFTVDLCHGDNYWINEVTPPSAAMTNVVCSV